MRRIAVLTFGLLVLHAVPALAAPDEVRQSPCRVGQPGEARSRLELTDMGDRIKVRFEVYRSPVGHRWRIVLQQQTSSLGHWPSAVVIFEGTRVAIESGDLVVQRRVPAHRFDSFRVRAVDTQTGEVCKIPRRGVYCQADEDCADDRGLEVARPGLAPETWGVRLGLN